MLQTRGFIIRKTVVYAVVIWYVLHAEITVQYIILNSVRQHNYFITQGNYIGYMFRL